MIDLELALWAARLDPVLVATVIQPINSRDASPAWLLQRTRAFKADVGVVGVSGGLGEAFPEVLSLDVSLPARGNELEKPSGSGQAPCGYWSWAMQSSDSHWSQSCVTFSSARHWAECFPQILFNSRSNPVGCEYRPYL